MWAWLGAVSFTIATAEAAAGPTASAAPRDSGMVLLGEMNCVACHGMAEREAQWVTPKAAPRLAALGSRVNPDWVRHYLIAPQEAMPELPLEAPSPTSLAASSRATVARVSERRRAIAHPTTPPPTITTS